MKTNVNISNKMLNWIMTQIHIDYLPSEVQQNLQHWLRGDKTPTYNQIEKASKATGIPLGYFFLQSPPAENLSLVDYRTVDSVALENPSRNLIDTIQDMELVQEWMREHLISEDASVLPFVGAFKRQINVADFADSIRRILDLPTEWFAKMQTATDSFRKIREHISESGVVVMLNGVVGNNTHRPLDINEFRAFTIIDDYAPLIFINSNDSFNGKLFSLLHEFVHICIGENNLFNDRYGDSKKVKKTETLCNAVAAELLVPQTVFIRQWNTEIQDKDAEQTILSLTKHFKCGTTVIARKALDNGFIDYALYEKIAQLAIKLYAERKKAKSGGDFYRTTKSRLDQRFFNMLANSVAEGKTLYSDAFRLTHTTRTSFTELKKRAEGGTR